MRERSEKIAIRIRPEIKAAARMAARDDHRSLSSFIEKTLADVLAAQSYLTAVKQQDLPLELPSRPGGLIRHG
jgi:hypothetical protein